MDREPFDDELDRLRRKRLGDMERAMEKRAAPVIMGVTDETFISFVQEYPHVIIDFWAEWCGPCRQISPVLEELAEEFAGAVAVGKCNTDENPRTSAVFSITAIPTLLLFSRGQMVDRITGAYPKEIIRTRMKRAFG